MTDQTPENTDPRPVDQPDEVTEAEFVTEPETDEPISEAELVDADVVDAEAETEVVEAEADAEVVEAEVVGLDLGTAEVSAPVATDFDAVAEPASPEPLAPAPAPSAGGSFLDLPPLPDLDFPAHTPPPASAYPPPASSYPQAANYPAAAQPQTSYAPYPADYSQQAAGQAYGHGAPAPAAQQQPAAMNPYGTPTGFAVAPYQPAGAADTTLASMAHWGALVADVLSGTALGFLVPLVIMLTKGKTDPFVRAHAVESLNFNLTVIIGMIVSAVLILVIVGIFGLILIPILALIFQIMAAMAASRGEPYRYPLSIRFVK